MLWFRCMPTLFLGVLLIESSRCGKVCEPQTINYTCNNGDFDNFTAEMSLNELQFQNNSLVDPKIFNGYSIGVLNLMNNKINNISNLRVNNLTSLTLDNNFVKRFDESIFKNIAILSVAHNQIEFIDEYVFENSHLIYLYLQYNFIEDLTFLKHLRYLRSLNLEHNNIKSMLPFMNNDMTKLNHVNLRHNKIIVLNIFIFFQFKYCTFNLDFNDIDRMDAISWQGISTTVNVTMGGNCLCCNPMDINLEVDRRILQGCLKTNCSLCHGSNNKSYFDDNCTMLYVIFGSVILILVLFNVTFWICKCKRKSKPIEMTSTPVNHNIYDQERNIIKNSCSTENLYEEITYVDKRTLSGNRMFDNVANKKNVSEETYEEPVGYDTIKHYL